jgi:TPR repeat protein
MRIKPWLLLIFGLAGPVWADMEAAQQALDEQNYNAAFKLFESHAKRQHIDAMYQLGIMYRDGLGVERDLARALEWFEEAGEPNWKREHGKLGSREAQYQAGLMHLNGQGTERDPDEAADWFEDAATQGHAPAQLALARLLLKGEGVGRDYQEAYVWAGMALNSFPSDEAKQAEARAIRDEAARNLSPKALAEANKEVRKRLAE